MNSIPRRIKSFTSIKSNTTIDTSIDDSSLFIKKTSTLSQLTQPLNAPVTPHNKSFIIKYFTHHNTKT